MAKLAKGRWLLYVCMVLSWTATLLIVLDILNLLTIPGPVEVRNATDSARKLDYSFFVSFNLFPALIVLNLIFWIMSIVFRRQLNNTGSFRSTLAILYVLVTAGLLAVLYYRVMYA